MQLARVVSTLNCLLQYRSTESTPTKSYTLKGATDNSLKKTSLKKNLYMYQQNFEKGAE